MHLHTSPHPSSGLILGGRGVLVWSAGRLESMHGTHVGRAGRRADGMPCRAALHGNPAQAACSLHWVRRDCTLQRDCQRMPKTKSGRLSLSSHLSFLHPVAP